jgi:glycosyltransferase involved in cell wall biosynthesis
MKILWFSWKDIHHPLAGGAEVVTDSLLSRLVVDGHDVTLLTSSYPKATHTDHIHGYTVVRVGGRLSVYWQAYKYYRKHLVSTHFDIIIEEVNTIPFFSKFYIQKNTGTTHQLFFHQLSREIWFHEMYFPLSLIGYMIEPLYLWLLRQMSVITISLSTRADLIRGGFNEEHISIISEGVHTEPLVSLDESIKYTSPTILSLGSIREMKRTSHIIQGFEYAKKRIPDLKLIIAGDSSSLYGRYVARLAARSLHHSDITMLGRVPDNEKLQLMEKSHIMCVTSVKEGWGLIVTEAGRRGTPAVVYNVDGLRDSVKNGISGLRTQENTPRSLGDSITELLSKPEYYKSIRKNAHEFSKTITFEKQYSDFKIVVGLEKKLESNLL